MIDGQAESARLSEMSLEGQTVDGVLVFFGGIESEEHDELVVSPNISCMRRCKDVVQPFSYRKYGEEKKRRKRGPQRVR